jgi:hypothetical protein
MDIHDPNYIGPHFPWYGCPVCGWSDYPQDGGFYQVVKSHRGNKFHEIPYVMRDKRFYPKPVYPYTKLRVYPIYSESSHGYEGDENWEETHKCPFCVKEFSFWNGT